MDSVVYHYFFPFLSIDPFFSQLRVIFWKPVKTIFSLLDYGYDSRVSHDLMASPLY